MKSFVMIQGVIYMLIVTSDIGNYLTVDCSNGIKLFSVFVCFMYLLLTFNRKSSGYDHLLMIIVIAVTFLADGTLLLTDHLEFGVFAFLIVQILYAYRISLFGRTGSHYWTYIFGGLGIGGASILIQTDVVIIAAVTGYGVLFLMNIWRLMTVQTLFQQKHTLFKIGFVLFFICDINVLVFNILSNYEISNLFYEFTRVSMWFFYLPAQVLLSISAVMENQKYQIR